MPDSINYIAVIVAAISSFIIGGLWYSPALFLNQWLKDMQLEKQDYGHPGKTFGIAFVFTLGIAVLMSTFVDSSMGLVDGALFGVKIGIGFVLCSFGINYQFANRPFRALAIDGGYHTIQFAVIGMILGAWSW